MLNEVFEEAKN